MAASSVRAFGLLGCLLTFFAMAPARAEPFFVRVYGKTYKIDPRYPPDEPKGPKPQEAMKALPSDIGKGSGFKPSHEQVLAEVEERLWIARNQLEDELDDAVGSRERNSGADPKTIKEEIAGSLAGGTAQARSPELQKLYDCHRALNLLVEGAAAVPRPAPEDAWGGVLPAKAIPRNRGELSRHELRPSRSLL